MAKSNKGKIYNVAGRAGRSATLTMLERYERYLEQFHKRQSSLARRGFISPVEKAGIEHPELTYEEFELAYEENKRSGVSATNIVREIVSSQLYFHTRSQAQALQEELKMAGITKEDGTEYTQTELRTYIGREKLSELNADLKRRGMSRGKERQEYISYYIFDSK